MDFRLPQQEQLLLWGAGSLTTGNHVDLQALSGPGIVHHASSYLARKGGGFGRAVVHHGRNAGLHPNPEWTMVGEQAGAWFGLHVGSAGDAAQFGASTRTAWYRSPSCPNRTVGPFSSESESSR